MRPGGHAPYKLLPRLAHAVLDKTAAIQSFHIHSFNQVVSTERWRHKLMGQLDRIIAC